MTAASLKFHLKGGRRGSGSSKKKGEGSLGSQLDSDAQSLSKASRRSFLSSSDILPLESMGSAKNASISTAESNEDSIRNGNTVKDGSIMTSVDNGRMESTLESAPNGPDLSFPTSFPPLHRRYSHQRSVNGRPVLANTVATPPIQEILSVEVEPQAMRRSSFGRAQRTPSVKTIGGTTSSDLRSAGGSLHGPVAEVTKEIRIDHPDAKDLEHGVVRHAEFQREDACVNRVKILVIMALVVTAFTVTGLTFHFTSKEQRDDFQAQYDELSHKVIDTFVFNMEMKIWTAFTLSTMFTSRFNKFPGSNHDFGGVDDPQPPMMGEQQDMTPYYGQDVDDRWPNVTINDFVEQTKSIRALSASKTVAFSPIVREMDREAWEAYAVTHQQYVGRSEASDLDNCTRDIQQYVDQLGSKTTSQCRTVAEGIYRLEALDSNETLILTDDGPGPYVPIWQVSPAVSDRGAIMYNQRSDPIRQKAIDHMLDRQVPSMTEFLFQEDVMALYPLIDKQTDVPGSLLYYPIFSDFGPNSTVEGTISIAVEWGVLFQDVLSDYTSGMDVVLSSSTNQQITYRLHGNSVDFVGTGDHHDRSYDPFAVHCSFLPQNSKVLTDVMGVDSIHDHMGHDHQRPHGQRLLQYHVRSLHGEEGMGPMIMDEDSSATTYTVVVYPSAQFESSYMTNEPSIYTGVVILIFLFTTAVFVIYDCLVERRQAVVSEAAFQTREIVHSLFPAVVRERMLKNGKNDHNPLLFSNAHAPRRRNSFLPLRGNRGGHEHNTWMESPLNRIRNFVRADVHAAAGVTSTVINVPSKNAPSETIMSDAIADLFPNTTIMCADIAGFTAWCSEREPQQVFHMLETVYGSFDKYAKDFGVFKVETVGDCYVAVTGLPEPNKDHALVMARFAVKVLSIMNHLVKELETTLGPGTASLTMRIGLHSGPVTAGVLRGEKSRFQLFGDTINTASRMESTGVKSMIQVSDSTAALLKQAGKAHWLVAREGLVTAKGKGELQTYWIKPRRSEALMRPDDLKTKKADNVAVATHDEGFIHDIEELRSKLEANESMTPWSDIDVGDGRNQHERLVKWNVAVLESFLIKNLAFREEATRSKRVSAKKRITSTLGRSMHGGQRNLAALGISLHGGLGNKRDKLPFGLNPSSPGSTTNKGGSLGRTLHGFVSGKSIASSTHSSASAANDKARNDKVLGRSFHGSSSNQKNRLAPLGLSLHGGKTDRKERMPSLRNSMHGGKADRKERMPSLRNSMHGIRDKFSSMNVKLQEEIEEGDEVPSATTASVELKECPSICLKEISDEIYFPSFDATHVKSLGAIQTSNALTADVLPPGVVEELHAFVSKIAQMYHNVPFHNFEHASHVTMSANKLVNRLLSQIGVGYDASANASREEYLYYSTFGLWSDPLAQFAVVFTALVHDAGHTGVPNAQLVKERHDLAVTYENQSVAEQHSVHVAWQLLLEPEFQNLRTCICPTEDELQRFRQLVINLLIATDIADRQRTSARKQRWEEAFTRINEWESIWQNPDMQSELALNLKATLVLEQIMLASDIAHTMQHFATFVKWNERLFQEMWASYVQGRADTDPREGWYESQIGFYDFYIIPLAKKLKDCGVFSTAGDEYLGNALENRRRWTEEGQAVTREIVSKIKDFDLPMAVPPPPPPQSTPDVAKSHAVRDDRSFGHHYLGGNFEMPPPSTNDADEAFTIS